MAKDYYPIASYLYIRGGQSLALIGMLTGTSTSTLSRWKKRGSWGRKRGNYLRLKTRKRMSKRIEEEL